MKKVLSVFLCFFVLFHSVATPASAVKVEEVATFEDAKGNEIRVLSYGVAPANAAAGVLYLTSTGGSMGAGVASIASAALPVLGYVLAAGIIVYSVVGLAEFVTNMYNSLSADAKAELEQIETAGVDNYTLSEYDALSSELPGVMVNSMPQFSVSFAVDRVLYSQGNASNYYVNGSFLPKGYDFPLTSTPTTIEGTSVSVSLVEAPFAGMSGVPSSIKYCIKFTNALTGVSLYYLSQPELGDAPGYAKEITDDSIFYFGAPVWTNTSAYGAASDYRFALPVVKACAAREAGRSCSYHDNTYRSEFIWENNINAATSPVHIYFTGTNSAELDNILFTGNYVGEGKTTLVPSLSAHPELGEVYLPQSAISLVLSDNFTRVGLTENPAMPEEEKPIFLPPSVALDNANLLTQSGALTGTWDTTIDGEKVETDTDVPGVDTEVGFWESILNWLEGFWDKFVEMLKTALMSLFVPSEGFFEDFIASISATFEDRMGILTYPISLLYEFCNHLLEVGQREPIFRWPGWSYQGTEFISAGSFNFNDILKNDTFKGLHDIYLLLVDAGIVWGLLLLLQKKYDSIIHH